MSYPCDFNFRKRESHAGETLKRLYIYIYTHTSFYVYKHIYVSLYVYKLIEIGGCYGMEMNVEKQK
jgi:hypothetical protein